MKQNFLAMAVWAIAAVAMAAGCSNVKAPINARQDPYVPRQIQLASEDLRKHTAFNSPVLTRDDSGLLFVEVPVRATTDQRVYIDYRVTFFDKNGQSIYQTAWFTKTLEPNTPDRLTANSVTSRAVDFQMDVRYAD